MLQGIQGYLNDFVDIVIVSYIIYQLLVLLRGTRAVQLLKGIIIVLITWLVSYFLHLNTLQWMIENLLSVGLIAIIIIFQPELRRALEKLGRGSFLNMTRQVKDQLIIKVANEVTRATTQLAEERIGALIVIERKTGLSDFIQSGISLKADVSKELLYNLFLPKGPLHDGAVIIRNDQIMAAGCYLPLTESPFVSKELGTRHRAAIGLTEVSDAVVIIVSEETGLISICFHGKLERGLTEEELYEQLYEALTPNERKPQILKLRKENHPNE